MTRINKWRLLVDTSLPAAMNMAIDDALFRLCSSGKGGLFPVIRFYQWENPTLSFGSSQKFNLAVNEEYCRSAGYDIVRRPTGGRAVLHDDEVTYSVIASIDDSLGNTIQETYRKISAGIIEGLRLLGVEAETEGKSAAGRNEGLTYLPCFASSTRFEIAFMGKKLVGSAQRRNNSAFLQHGSILMSFNSKELLRSIGADDDMENPDNYMTSISEVTGQSVNYEQAVNSLTSGFERSFEIQLDRSSLTDEEVSVAEFFRKTKYSTVDWNKCK